jgi:D-amino-acid oxidase
MSCDITIVGGGIIGLTTACTLLKEYSANPNLTLEIISETFSPDTTGDISAGLWEPYGLGLNDERMLQWAQYAYDVFVSEFSSTKAARAGIMTMPCYALHGFNGDDQGRAMVEPNFSKLVRHYRLLDERELEMFDRTKPTAGFVMSTVIVEVQQYLQELHRFLSQDSRVKFVRKKILSFSELANRTNLVVNCTGLGARQLTNDDTVRPARGQVKFNTQCYPFAIDFSTV